MSTEKETREFIKIIKGLNDQQQTAAYLMIQATSILDKNKTAPKRNS